MLDEIVIQCEEKQIVLICETMALLRDAQVRLEVLVPMDHGRQEDSRNSETRSMSDKFRHKGLADQEATILTHLVTIAGGILERIARVRQGQGIEDDQIMSRMR